MKKSLIITTLTTLLTITYIKIFPAPYMIFASSSATAKTSEISESNEEIPTESKEEDFDIKNGVLINYKGTAPVIKIPDGVTEIGSYAFWHTSAEIIELYLPDSVETLAESAFSNYYGGRITGGNGVKEIGRRAFMYSTAEIPDFPNAEKIEAEAFYLSSVKNDSALERFRTFAPEAFEAIVSKDTDFIVENGVLKKYMGNASIINIPDGVKTIGANIFRIPPAFPPYIKTPNYLIEVHFPQSVQTIGARAFQYSFGLKKVTGTENVKEIGKRAFYDSGIKELNLPSAVKIGDEAFYRSAIEKINLPNVESIGNTAFYLSRLSELNGLGKVKEIGTYAFDNCPFSESTKKRYRVTQKLPNGNENIFFIANGILFGTEDYCHEDLIIPDGVTEIATCIWGSYISVTIPDSVIKIGDEAFAYNSKLRWVKMGDSVEKIGRRAFAQCKNLTQVRLSNSVRELYECFKNCYQLKSITLPAAIEKISADTFPDGITTIICPASLTNLVSMSDDDKNRSFLDSLPLDQGTFYVPEAREDSPLASYARELGWDYRPIGLETTELTLKVGEQYPLRFQGGAKATWKTSNKTVATVGSTGNIYAKKAGKVTITATIYGKEYKCQVTVIKPEAATSPTDTSTKTPNPTPAPTTPSPADAIPLNEEYFPDANFREYLSLCVDGNRDGILSQKERDALTSIRNTDEEPEMEEYEYNELGVDEPDFWYRFYLNRVSSFQGTRYFRHLKEFVLMDDTRGSGELFLAGDDLEIFMTNSNFTAIHIENQEKLQHFQLSVANHMDYLDLSGTQDLENLLILGDVKYSFEVFARNKKLRRVWITCGKMAAEDAAYLNGMPNLEYLTIWGRTDHPIDVIDLGADTKLKKFILSADSLSKLILPSEAVEIELSCAIVYPEIIFGELCE